MDETTKERIWNAVWTAVGTTIIAGGMFFLMFGLRNLIP